ncbi:MAG TPA: carboxypeptidase-like regulatory domain-containing protein [Daejeonella sp.]|uniref:carboxypeptidase-like regulatory domain-containing protein n=1 Tax=Daejeonella sp. TaxID=2805397 RepID=UPI002ED9A30F
MEQSKKLLLKFSMVLLTALTLLGTTSSGQSLLGKNIFLKLDNQKLENVLQLLEERGGFKFSFNSNIIPLDSIVNLYAENVSIGEVLDRLLKNQFEYQETHNFVILRYAPLESTLLLEESFNYSNQFVIKGQIVDKNTHNPVVSASVYEKNLLQSAITDQDGFFTLRLKNFPRTIRITVSKENYKDLNTLFLSEVIVRPEQGKISGDYLLGDLSKVEKTRVGRMLVTSKQRIQSLNIGSFIAQAPVQLSLSPGLSSHGSLSGQVINKFSFNATGGYSAGVEGMEVGLLFNITKQDAEWFQFGGAFNLVGGKVRGLQVAGLYNNVLDSAKATQVTLGYNRVTGSFNGFQVGGLYNNIGDGFIGVQVSLGHNRIQGYFNGLQMGGLSNHIKGDFEGVQLSLGYNNISNSFNGFQSGTFNYTGNNVKGVKLAMLGNYNSGHTQGVELAGISNYSKTFKGLRISLLGNFSSHKAEGVQIAGVFNYAKEFKGFQFGLINIADTASGYNIGLFNLFRKGYHKVGLTSNETIDLNLAIKTGNEKLYTMLMAGMNRNGKLQAFGLGFGKEMNINKQLYFNPEISSRYLYRREWKGTNLLNRVDLKLNYEFNKWIALTAGPALNIFYSNQIGNYTYIRDRHISFNSSDQRFKGWIGWDLGLIFF